MLLGAIGAQWASCHIGRTDKVVYEGPDQQNDGQEGSKGHVTHPKTESKGLWMNLKKK